MKIINESLTRLEQALGYEFNNKILLSTALTHRSASQDNNERLEYLGDALLGLIIAEVLFNKFPNAAEGELTRLRASLVKGESLAALARKIELGNYLTLGGGELKSGGWRRDSILANTFEAIIGAIYQDAGMDVCRDRILSIYKDLLEHISPEQLHKDPKTRLQEYLQSHKHTLPDYKIIAEEGAAHEKKFSVQCNISELDMSVQADGRSKRNAEQAAAQKLLDILQI